MAKSGYFGKIARRAEPRATALRPPSAVLRRWGQVGDVDYVATPVVGPRVESTPARVPVAPATVREPEVQVKRERIESAPAALPKQVTPEAPIATPARRTEEPSPPATKLTPQTRAFLEEPARAATPTPIPVEPPAPSKKGLPIFEDPILPKPFAPPVPELKGMEPPARRAQEDLLTVGPKVVDSPRVEPPKLEPKAAPRVEPVVQQVIQVTPVSPAPPQAVPPLPRAAEKPGTTLEIGSIEIRVTKEAPAPSVKPQRPARAAQAPAGSGRLSRGWQTPFGWRQG